MSSGYYGTARRCEKCVTPCSGGGYWGISHYYNAKKCYTDQTHGKIKGQWIYGFCLHDGDSRLKSASTSNPKLKHCGEFKLDHQGLPKDIIQPVPDWSLTMKRTGIDFYAGKMRKKRVAGDCSYWQMPTLGVQIKGRWALS